MSIFGARPYSKGRILIQGRPVNIRSPQEAIRAGIGYLSEDRKESGLFLEMTVAENVGAAKLEDFGCWWLDDKAMEQKALSFANRLRLAATAHGRAIRELSGGNQQKVMIARWLLVQSPIFLVDEPTRGIDVGAKMEVHQVLRELAREGVALVLISSELTEILALADRILVMREGRLTGEISRNEATEERILRMATLPHAHC
jgi:ABC-type sugar transport system ATPase subunit